MGELQPDYLRRKTPRSTKERLSYRPNETTTSLALDCKRYECQLVDD